MKRVKAWAVVDKRGSIIKWDALMLIYKNKTDAEYGVDLEGERVVPVEIVIQEEK